MTSNSPQIESIKARYKASLNDKKKLIDFHITNIEKHTNVPFSGSGANDLFAQIHGDLHKLAGSSGMYDYLDIAEVSRNAMEDVASEDCSSLLDSLRKLSELLGSHFSR